MAASSEVQVAVFVDVDLHILADLPAPETVGVGVPEPVDERDRVILDLHPHLLGFGVDDLGSLEQVEAALERAEVCSVKRVEELEGVTGPCDVLESSLLDGADVSF